MLLDNFHSPLSDARHWDAFHSHWVSTIAADLNRVLPPDWFAESNVHYGIEIDVATFEASGVAGSALDRGGRQVDSAEQSSWTPPAPLMTIEFPPTTDIIEVRVFRELGGAVLEGAIEFVSPANKDRPENHGAFVSKRETYLREGIGLVVVDLVTTRKANLHHDLLERCGQSAVAVEEGWLYTSAYHVAERDGQPALDVWCERLEVGRPLPVMPLFLHDGLCVQVDLPETYVRACGDLRISLSQEN